MKKANNLSSILLTCFVSVPAIWAMDDTQTRELGRQLFAAVRFRRVDELRQVLNRIPKEQVANVVNYTDSSGWTLLHFAAKDDSVDAARLLLDAGADLERVIPGGWTVLHLAVCRARVETTRLLLQRGAAANCSNDSGETPLCRAAYNSSLELARLLLDHGADTKHRHRGRRLLDWVLPDEISQLFLERDSPVTDEESDIEQTAINNRTCERCHRVPATICCTGRQYYCQVCYCCLVSTRLYMSGVVACRPSSDPSHEYCAVM